MSLDSLLGFKNSRQIKDVVPANLQNVSAQLASIATEFDTIVTGLDNYYVKCLSTDTGALLVVASGATTGQINLSAVSPRMSNYTPIAGDYVTLASNLLTAEVVLSRASAVKGKTFSNLDGRLEELDADTYMPMTNFVSNGDFSNGITGWEALYSTNTASANTLTNTCNGASSVPSTYKVTNLPVTVGKKVYVSAKIRVTNALCQYLQLAIDDNVAGTEINKSQVAPFQNTWYTLTSVVTLPADFSGSVVVKIRHAYADTTTANGKVMEVQYVMVEDLTTPFSAGNEPSQAQNESMLSYYPNSWFDGTVNLAKNTRLVPYLLNNIRQLNLEKTSYGVYSGLTVSAQATPDMTVNAATGIIYMANGRRFAPTAIAALAVSTADATNPRVDIVYVDSAGVIRYLAGTAAASPSAPAVSTDGQKLYEINVSAGATAITSAMLVDKRRLNWQETWITPTLLNGWTEVNGYPVRYMKDSMGFVHLKGRLQGGTIGTNCFALPTGYKPLELIHFVLPHNSTNSFVIGYIDSAGNISIETAYSSFVVLYGITFKAEK